MAKDAGGARRSVRLGLSILAALALAAALSLCLMLAVRHYAVQATAAKAPADPVPLGAATPAADRTCKDASLVLTLIDAPGEHTVDVTWDDAWFGAGSTAYRGDLAYACAALSTLAYSESGHYQQANPQPAYMEDALAELGFAEVSTESYRFRSEVSDQILNFVTQDEDKGAYTIARRRLAPQGGDGTRSVLLVVVRGSYGSEWLSNADLSAAGDHPGYRDLVDEITAELGNWVSAAHAAGDSVTVLACGHSRGGAIAGMVAARAIDGEAGVDASAGDEVLAYTFAASRCTTDVQANDARYDGIVNVVNAADVVPQLPLASWGYVRYGRDVVLAAEGEDAEAAADVVADEGGVLLMAQEPVMEEAYRAIAGCDYGHHPLGVASVTSLVRELGSIIASPANLSDPLVVARAVFTAASVGPDRLLAGHYPSVYLSWLAAANSA